MSWRRWILVVAASSGLAVVASERPAAARLPDAADPRLDEWTALTLGGQTLKLGILAFDYGITDRINIGTDPPGWLVRSATSVLVPNLHLKVIAYQRDRLWLSGRAAFYYADVSKGDASGSLFVVPFSAFASYHLNPIIWLHGEVTYNMVLASGAGSVDDATLGGTATTRGLQLGAMVEYRLTPTVALTLRGRLQVYTGPLAFSNSGSDDPLTTVDVEARITARDRYPWVIIPGVAFLWQRIRLTVGVGYGNYFVPGLDIPLAKKSIAPEASFSVLL